MAKNLQLHLAERKDVQVVATFCHNIARGLPIQVNDPAAPVTLVYVDDVIERFVGLMDTIVTASEARQSMNPQAMDCRAALAMTED